jgi:hypothetical protein
MSLLVHRHCVAWPGLLQADYSFDLACFPPSFFLSTICFSLWLRSFLKSAEFRKALKSLILSSGFLSVCQPPIYWLTEVQNSSLAALSMQWKRFGEKSMASIGLICIISRWRQPKFDNFDRLRYHYYGHMFIISSDNKAISDG